MSDIPSIGPFFIGGAGRSGTTLLRAMLDAHRNICCGPELKILPDIAKTYQKLIGPLAGVMASYNNSPQELSLHFRRLIEGMVENFRRISGKPRWGEKTPHNVLHMAALAGIFPDARFLHVIRDGRDVACSLVTMNWMNPTTGAKVDYIRNIGSAGRYWRGIVESARRQAARPELIGKVLEVRYEHLVRNTESTLRQVIEFIGEDWDDSVLSHHSTFSQGHKESVESSTDQASRPVYETSIGRWRNQMTDADKDEFKREAAALLIELGYASEDW